jgi:predicted signal transduction protein with EAL and GGDEF domain
MGALPRPDTHPPDSLTGLPARAALIDELRLRQADGGKPVALAVIEVAGLARFNDLWSRAQGDRLLLSIARRLLRLARDEFGSAVICYRMDGARFAVVPPLETGVDRLRAEVRGIVGLLAEVTGIAGEAGLALRVAVGGIVAHNPVEPGLDLIARRLSGSAAVVRAIDVEAATQGEGLSVLFQPQFRVADDALIGAEALARWHHPRLGEVGGALLFSAAAAAGLERPMSDAVWRCALAKMAGWPEPARGLRIALNVTAADLADGDMPERLLAMAAHEGIDPARLTVEITEQALIQQLDSAAASLDRLRSAGVRVALDDFGTGYSGLSWLRRLPVDYIKIDSSFAQDAAGSGPRGQAVLRGVVELAAGLDLGVLAEGVESREQLDRLAALGCRWYQGFFKAPALPEEALLAMVAAT